MTRTEVAKDLENIIEWTHARDDGLYESLEDALYNIKLISENMLRELDGALYPKRPEISE